MRWAPLCALRRIAAATGAALLAWTVLGAAPAGATAPVADAPEAVDIMALNPEIEEFIDARVRPSWPRDARVRGLMDALFGRDGLDITYGNLETKTAVETFESGSGNCLSFTILFVAMARHLGLKARFQEVGEILSWNRRGDVAVSNRHMFAEVLTSDGDIRVDFLPGIEKRYRSVRAIGEHRVLAHFYSNLGAEALTKNDLEGALEKFAKALTADETLAAAWVNKGVAHRRLGQVEESEACYLRALELDPREISAASNLAGLYRSTGRPRLAGPYVKKVKRHQRSNPFYHFQRGMELAEEGQFTAAGRRIRRAIRLIPEDVMFRRELGRVQAGAGRFRKAERSYVKALRLTTDDRQRLILEELLKQARAGAA